MLQIQLILCTDISDHFPVFNLIQNFQITSPGCMYSKRIINVNSLQTFTSILQEIDWAANLICSEIQMAYMWFSSDLFSLSYNAAFPWNTFTDQSRSSKPWLRDGLRSSIKCKNKLYTIFRRNRTQYNEMAYNAFKDKLQHAMKTGKKLHSQSWFAENTQTLCKSWNILKEIIGLISLSLVFVSIKSLIQIFNHQCIQRILW